MELGVHIREMTKADWQDVSRIYAQGLKTKMSTFQTEVPSYSQWDNNHISACRFVITMEHAVVGWCALSPISSRSVYQGVGEVSIYLDETYQGKGYGKQLLNKLCEASQHAGFWMLQSSIFEENLASIQLHQQCGFRMVGYREKIAKDCDGIWRNTILVERRVVSDEISKEDVPCCQK